MSPEIHQRIRFIFDAALERPEAERLAFLEEACGQDQQVYSEVKKLLDAHVDAHSFLEERPTSRSERIDRYLIKCELGRGAMGVVYEAADPLIGRTIAIKVISLEATSPKEVEFMRDSLFREARSAGGLSHPGIVTIFDVGQENDTAFITMERVEGPNLQNLLDSGGIGDTDRMLDILRQTAAALDYAHQSGVVHRDVKPANIMIHKGTTVKVTDFGIAKLAASATKTLTGLVMGTPAYMSPEQIETKPLDGRTDQFSLAVVAFEILTGSKPFEGNLLGPLMHSIIFGDRPSARALNPALPPGIDEVLHRGMRRLPEERFGSCAELVAALEACFPSRVAPPPPPPLQPRNTASVVQTGQYIPPPVATLQSGAYPGTPGTFAGSPPPSFSIPPQVPQQPNLPQGKKSALPLILVLCGVVVLAGGGFGVYRFVMPVINERLHGKNDDNKKDDGNHNPAPTQPPAVAQFTADPPTIEVGGAATLRWEVTGATEVSIDQGVGTVQPGGQVQVKPQESTTYVISAKGPGGSAAARVAVAVTAGTKPPEPIPSTPPSATAPKITAFRTDPASVRQGDRFRLDWNVQGATQVTIDHGVGTVPTSGNRSEVADATTTYTITATGSGGTTTAKTTVSVAAAETATDLYDKAVEAQKAQQPARAVSLFQQAATRGDPRAMLELGKIYMDGKGVAPDMTQATNWFEKSANAGNASGMVYTGAMYAQGKGVPKSDQQAFSWYNKAATAGNAAGMDGLGLLYRDGRGVGQNYQQALTWFKKAGDAGNAHAYSHLAAMYENGMGVPRNPTEAANDYRKAAALGDNDASRHLTELQGPGGQAGHQTPVRVAANVPWTDTGIDLRDGDLVEVKADGTARLGASPSLSAVSPAGVTNNCAGASSVYGRAAGTFPAPALACWSLVGRINGPAPGVFGIGAGRRFQVKGGGRLYLGVNDDNVSDNSGSWNVMVTVTSR